MLLRITYVKKLYLKPFNYVQTNNYRIIRIK